MKKLLIILFSLFFLSSPSVFADDISDFQIEGISIGDSLLDYMTEDEFIALVNQNIKNQAVDLIILLGLISLLAGLKAAAPDDDEDVLVRNQYKFLLKATDKLTDELMYFYNPTTPLDLISGKGGIFPSIGLLDNYKKFFTNFVSENYGIITNNEEIQDDATPIKYLMKSFPIASQASGYLPMFYPSLAKDLGIKMQSQYGIR